MNKRLSIVLAATLALIAFVGTSSASAATEFGSACSADGYFNGGEISVAHGTSSPLPVAAPSSGVITEWKVNVGTFPVYEPEEAASLQATLYQQLYVVKASDALHYTVIGKSESERAAVDAPSSFLTRIPVQQGDLLALAGPTTLYCTTEDRGDATANFRGTPGVGGVIETHGGLFIGFQVPVVAKIEPDVDGDGYGDETQDKCPQSAAYHEACPVVKLSALPIVGTKAVTLRVSTSLAAPVAVTATVPLGKGKKATLSAPGQTVSPGSLAGFTLKLTPPVTKALKALPPKKSLAMKITAGATNLVGAPSKAVATVKLKGQGEPAQKNKKKQHHKKPKQK
jgi:hypothetical protein